MLQQGFTYTQITATVTHHYMVELCVMLAFVQSNNKECGGDLEVSPLTKKGGRGDMSGSREPGLRSQGATFL